MTKSQPRWLIKIAIEPKSNADQERLGIALSKLVVEDSSLLVSVVPRTGQTFLLGLNELHLDAKIQNLIADYSVALNIGAPEVAYLEKLTNRVEIDYTYKKQTVGAGQFARVKIIFEPNAVEAGNVFASKIVDRSFPKEYVLGVERGIRSALEAGIVAGFPVVDLKATLLDCAFHDVDCSVLAFEIASRTGTREALQKGGSVLLEPIMKVEVLTSEEYTGSIIGDLNLRRGQIQRRDIGSTAANVAATVPLANMFGYDNQLRSFTQGRATYTMQFDHYAAVPPKPDHDPTFRPAMGMRA